MRLVSLVVTALAAMCWLLPCGSAVLADANEGATARGAQVFPFEGKTADARLVGLVLSRVLDAGLGNSPAFPGRLRHTGHAAAVLTSSGLTVLDPVRPELAARVTRRIDGTAAVCGTVRPEGDSWRMDCQAYDRDGRPVGDGVHIAGSLNDIGSGLPEAGRALAEALGLSREEAARVGEWCTVPPGGLEEVAAALGQASWQERLVGLVEVADAHRGFSLPHTLALELYVIGDQQMEEVGSPEPMDSLRDRTRDRFSEHADVMSAVMIYSLARGHYDVAEQAAREVRQLCPGAIAAEIVLAVVAGNAGELVKAVGLRRLIAAKLPDSASAASGLARSLLYRARAARHGQYFGQMTEENQDVFSRSVEEALVEARRAAALDEERADIWSLVFQCAMENGENALAEEALDRAIELMPYDTELWGHAAYYFSPGYVDDRDGWLALQRRLLTARPGSFAELYAMASALDDYRMGFMGADTEVITRLFEEALAQRPAAGRARAYYVQALIARGATAEVEQEFAKLKEEDGVTPRLYHLIRGLMLRAEGDTAGARAAYQQSKEAGGDYFWNVRCDNYVAEAYVHDGNLDAAQDILESVYSTWMHFYDVNYLLAYIYHKQGNDADALGVLSDIEPNRREGIWVTATVPASEYPVSDIARPRQLPKPPDSDVPEGWRLVFHDEFDGDSILPEWTVGHGEWGIRKDALCAMGGEGFQLIAAPGEYGDAQIEFQMMCESGDTWAGAFLRNPGESIGDQRGYLRFLSWGGAELFNIHQANRIAVEYPPTVSPGDWWWVRVRVEGREAAAWISSDRREWVCADWGEVQERVPERGRILLSAREGQRRAAFRHVKIYAPSG
jgi:tetratricopeptide (TPR) repeat protein